MADGLRPAVTFAPGSAGSRALRDAFGQFATGVTLITIRDDDGPAGFIANSFSSLSLDPALVMWALAKSSRRHARFAAAQRFAIHILSAAQAPLLDRFGRDGRGFEGMDFAAGAGDVPLIDGALALLECTQYGVHDGGDHTLILGAVSRVAMQPGDPLIFAQGRLRPLPR